MKHPQLKVEKREITGKKVKNLRKSGILPANVYGKDIPSVAVQLPEKDFLTIYKEVGETGLIDLQLDGATRPVLIKNIAKDYRNDLYLHADFYQVNLKEKIKSMVPVVTVGEAKAVVDKIGLLMQTLSEVEVEALPEELPEKLEINVEPLSQIDQQFTVADLKAPANVTILTDPGQVVVKISELVSKEAEEQAAAEAAAAAEAKAAEGAEGEVPAEGAEPKPEEEKKEEAPKEEKAAE